MQRREELERLCRTARRAYRLRLTPATAGNISLRGGGCGTHEMRISASGCCLGDLRMDELVAHPSGEEGRLRVSSEVRLHAALYRVQTGARSILHHHGLWTVLAGERTTSGRWKPAIALPEFSALSRDGDVPVVGRLAPGSANLAEKAARLARGSAMNGLILRGHGAVTWGAGPEEALHAAEILEEAARLDYFYRAEHLPGTREEDSPC